MVRDVKNITDYLIDMNFKKKTYGLRYYKFHGIMFIGFFFCTVAGSFLMEYVDLLLGALCSIAALVFLFIGMFNIWNENLKD